MKILKVFLLLLAPLLLLTALLVLATGATSYKVYVIHTGSMGPHIPSGSAVLVHEGHYRVGQVITFTEDGLTVTHRLMSISATGYITTKGDANATNDPWHVPKSQIIGGVVVAPRYVGYWIMYLKNPLGLASVLLALLALWQIWSLTSVEELGSAESVGSSSDDSPKRPLRSARSLNAGNDLDGKAGEQALNRGSPIEIDGAVDVQVGPRTALLPSGDAT